MATTTPKKSTKKTSAQKTKPASTMNENIPEDTQEIETVSSVQPNVDIEKKSSSQSQTVSNKSMWLVTIIVGLIVGAVVFIATNKGTPVVAIVNGQPIFKWDLNDVMNSRFGKQTLEGMITESLIRSEAQKQQVVVTQADIDQRAEEILASFGSSLSIDDFLQLQGISREEFNNQLKLQLEVQKILTKDLTITDNDVAAYIASNAAMLMATEPAQLQQEARGAMVDEHISKVFEGWLQDIRTKASIQQFL